MSITTSDGLEPYATVSTKRIPLLVSYYSQLLWPNCLNKLTYEYFPRWYDDCNVQEFGISKKQFLLAYFLAMASIFESERSLERFAFVKSHIISNMISSYFNKLRRYILGAEFTNSINSMRISGYTVSTLYVYVHVVVQTCNSTLYVCTCCSPNM